MALLDFVKKLEPDKKKSPFMHTLYDGFFTFLYAPATVTKGGVHIRDGMDLKRTMVHVVLALQALYLLGSWNIGQQHFNALGMYESPLSMLHLKLWFGIIKLLPLFVISNVVGLGIEFYFATKKGHPIEEGYLVTGALIPLIVPPDVPLWVLAFSIVFAVIIGKEAFGGTGMNVLNIALLSRAFIFFAYPTTIAGSGDVWITGIDSLGAGKFASDYGWGVGMGDWLFGLVGLPGFPAEGLSVVDGFSGATPLQLAYEGGWEKVTSVYSFSDILWGNIPGSIGEMFKPFIILGAIFLAYIGIASWRVMLGMVVGCVLTGLIFNAWGYSAFMNVPWYYQPFLGSFLFAMAFMATDPVTAASTNRGKWIYGILIGIIGLVIRVMNPAYPEGWMLAILFMNVFAPLIDYFVIQSNITKRINRGTAK